MYMYMYIDIYIQYKSMHVVISGCKSSWKNM